MPTREKLENALINAHKSGDTAAAKQLANALKSGSYYDEGQEVQASPEASSGDQRQAPALQSIQHQGQSRQAPLQPQQQSPSNEPTPSPYGGQGAQQPPLGAAEGGGEDNPMSLAAKSADSPPDDPEKPQENGSIIRDLEEAFLKIPGAPALGEFAAAANRSVFDMADFLGPDTVNAVLELAGSEKRMPTLGGTLASPGGYMEPGLARDVTQAAGETAPAALAFGQMLRSMAGRLAPFAQGESALTGTARQLGASTAKQDAVGGALAGAGGEIGEKAGGDTGRVVGTVAAAALPALPELAKMAFRGGSSGLKNINAAIKDFSEIDRAPTLGQAKGDGFWQGFENLSSKLLGGGPIRKSFDDTSAAMKSRITAIADDLSTTRGNMEAGRTIEKGITGSGGFVERFQNKSGQLWNKFDSLIDDTAPVTADKTTEALGRLVNDTDFGRVLNNPLIAKIKTVMDEAGGRIDYGTFRQLRSAIGERLGSKDLISDIPRAQLKQLYGALSQDLKGVAAQYGDDAVNALSRANIYTKSGHARLGGFVERIVKKTDLDKVFNAATQGGEGVQAINAIKRSLKPDEWEVVASNVLRKLGRATSGNQDDAGAVFSVNKFLTDWDKLGRAKNALLSGSVKLNRYRNSLDKIASAANRIKEGSKAMENPSGTGQFMANVGTLTTGGTALGTGNMGVFGTVLAGVAANNSAARLMTSPKFVLWLSKGINTSDWAAHVAKLTTVAETPEQAEAVHELLSTIQEGSRQASQNTLEPRKVEQQPQ